MRNATHASELPTTLAYICISNINPSRLIHWHKEPNIIVFPERSRESFNSFAFGCQSEESGASKLSKLSQKLMKRDRHSEAESCHLSRTVFFKKDESFSGGVYSFPLTIKRL